MKNLTKTVLSFWLMMGVSDIAFAQQGASAKTEFSIEIDPATFAFKGYGFHLRVKPKNSEHLLVGFGAYAMDFPDLLVDLNDNNKDQGWNVRLNQGYGLFGEYHFSEVNKKWFLGGQLALQEYKIQKDYYDGESKYTNVLLMATGGYTLQPFDYNLYFKFWGGVGYTVQVGGDNSIGDAEYDISPILMFGALHIGYIF